MIKCSFFLIVFFIKYIFSDMLSINLYHFPKHEIISIYNSKQNKFIPIIFMDILAGKRSRDDRWHRLMPEPVLKVFRIIIPRDCQTAVTVVLNVKGHLNTFRHWVLVNHTLLILCHWKRGNLEDQKIGILSNASQLLSPLLH